VSGTEHSENVLLQELKWVHDLIRRDLRSCRQLADDVANGASPTEIRAQVEELKTHGGLFLLRMNCLRHCQFVHSHHGHEDHLLFPALRRTAPDLSEVVDKLQADHRSVSDLLDEVVAVAVRLGPPGAADERRHLVAALEQLSATLLEHLAYEEENLGPVLASWDMWPFFG
jgi:iron-sulfur cluster repair protein YtfE (RIC family)